MTLIYKFKKEKLEGGRIVSRPKILVGLKHGNISFDIVALIDSGCDITVLPQSIAKALGLSTKGKRDKMYGYREVNEVVESALNISFIGKVERQSVTLNRVPVLIALKKDKYYEENEITLGVQKIFDEFDVIFKKSKNKIEFKKVSRYHAKT